MATKKWNGKTVEMEDGYLPADVLKAMRKRLAEEKGKKPRTKKPAKKK